eukprot:TRINITY_DN4839_c0_g1_i1.p1 TRINITY_DN4839_c0_g1~~TRINITY_DN4839_c0_g1_i1.p1  ORF type:complete len:294 (-),score=65.33 TRINITY_DN4839_c0_g1_i1:43-924(-)
MYVLKHFYVQRKIPSKERVPIRSLVTMEFKSLVLMAIFFYGLWVVANYSYTRALKYTSATAATAIFSMTPALIFIFSIIILKDPIRALRVIAVAFSVAGVFLISWNGKSLNNAKEVGWVGDALVVLASFAAAFYQVLFKYRAGEANTATVTAFLSTMGAFNLSIMWIVPLALDSFAVEILDADSVPWNFLILSSVLSLFYNFLINFGISYTYPLFVSLGTVLGIPLNAIIDTAVRGRVFGWAEISGGLFITIGFLLLLVPYTISEVIAKFRGNAGYIKQENEDRSPTPILRAQ